ncbi:hypothetical protein D3C72_2093640 [compost metagenome]
MYMDDAENTQSDVYKKFLAMRQHYTTLIGKKALYKTGRSEARVVTIEEVFPCYIRVSYNYYGRDYSGKLSTCILFGSLISQDDWLEVK